MGQQLILINPSEKDWRLDEHTRDVGRRGLAEARAALGRTRPPVQAPRKVRVGAGK